MTTRREFTQGSMAALFMAFLASFKPEDADTLVAEPPVHERLIDLRDEIEALADGHDTIYGLSLMVAAHNINHAIMRRCPHDPADYSRDPDEEVGGQVYEGGVSCPHCRARTYARNAKRAIDEEDRPL